MQYRRINHSTEITRKRSPHLPNWTRASSNSAGPVVRHAQGPPGERMPALNKEMDASQAERLDRSCLSIVPRSRSHARIRRNATMNHVFSCVQPAFIDL
ncbi:hypothetical protein EVAR_49598_1 [Eumeta japonica]|uniref:Uncharacterized protein n=1 Tax=Eumeta variegata TaxID=151549 RepID=A0A4C1XZ64_EUMVA|nr:hypothetical protein EVAR_49598_1 [Eumeta japonica]